MPIRQEVLPAADVEPEVLATSRLQNQLVEVGVALEPVEPAVGGLQVGVAPVDFVDLRHDSTKLKRACIAFAAPPVVIQGGVRG